VSGEVRVGTALPAARKARLELLVRGQSGQVHRRRSVTKHIEMQHHKKANTQILLDIAEFVL
jgi:hypothetical protein